MSGPLKNARHERFALEYLIDLNATQAAIRAGYSAKTAEQQASRLLRNVKIQARISELQAERSGRTQIDADWVLRRLASEALADIRDILGDDGSLKPVSEWPLVWRQGLVSGIEVEDLYEGRGEAREKVGRVHKVKLSDRIRRIELIGRHVGVQAFKDKVEVDVSEDLAAAIAAGNARVMGGSKG